MRQPFRIEPLGPAQAFETYTIAQPIATHWRTVRCEDAPDGCAAHQHGWTTTVDTSTPLGVAQARYIIDSSGRSFTRPGELAADMITFAFPAGQQCFAQHRVPIGRDPMFRRRPGDHRRIGGTPYLFARAEDWRDDLGERLETIADRRKRG